MIIIEQNINQDNYKEYLTNENCFDTLVSQNADIIILNGVVRPEYVSERIKILSNGKYNYVNNENNLYCNDKYGNIKLYNKILIFFNNKYQLIYKNENLYSIENRSDFLHITLNDIINNNKINVIGIRMQTFSDDDSQEKQNDDAKKNYETFCKILKYCSLFDNVILAGDFNNGWIAPPGNEYKRDTSYYYYNYHKLHNAIINNGDLKLLTDGIDTDGYTLDRIDLTRWTSYSKDKEMKKINKALNNHYIVSNNFVKNTICIVKDEDIEKVDRELIHRIVRLEGDFNINSRLKKNPLLTDEFRINLCYFLEFFQFLEYDLKRIFAKLIDGHYPECFDEVAEKPIGALIKKLKEVEKNENVEFLSDDDYKNLEKVKDMRNYWCHTCFIQGDGYLEQQADMSIIKKSRGLIERIIKEKEIVRLLSIKMSSIADKIPEKVGKWQLTDFIKITGVHYIQLETNDK